MPRDIQVFLEKKSDNKWNLVLPMINHNGFNYQNPDQNQVSDTMYINEYYPEEIYSEYNPSFWEAFGVEGRFSKNSKDIPFDCCKEIRLHHESFGDEAFQEHWLYCNTFLAKVESGNNQKNKTTINLLSKIKSLGQPREMRLILWFNQ